jgi:hypothetical protein
MENLNRRTMLGSLSAMVAAVVAWLTPRSATAAESRAERVQKLEKLSTSPFPRPFILPQQDIFAEAPAIVEKMKPEYWANEIRQFGEAADVASGRTWSVVSPNDPAPVAYISPSYPAEGDAIPAPELAGLRSTLYPRLLERSESLTKQFAEQIELLMNLEELGAVKVYRPSQMGSLPTHNRPSQPFGERCAYRAIIDLDEDELASHRHTVWHLYAAARWYRFSVERCLKGVREIADPAILDVEVLRYVRPRVTLVLEPSNILLLTVALRFGVGRYSSARFPDHTWPAPDNASFWFGPSMYTGLGVQSRTVAAYDPKTRVATIGSLESGADRG